MPNNDGYTHNFRLTTKSDTTGAIALTTTAAKVLEVGPTGECRWASGASSLVNYSASPVTIYAYLVPVVGGSPANSNLVKHFTIPANDSVQLGDVLVTSLYSLYAKASVDDAVVLTLFYEESE